MSSITSLQNPLVRTILKLDKSRERRKQNLFSIEGIREIKLAIDAGFEIQNILFCSEYISAENLKNELNLPTDFQLTDTSSMVFDALVYRKAIANALALAKPKTYDFGDIDTSKQVLILIIDAVEKPGNLGAMLRTCDAAGVDAIVVCDPKTDVYNPNCIRSSLGAVFTKKTIVTTSEDCMAWLNKNHIATYITFLDSARNYTLEDYTKSTAIVVGSEARGLQKQWLEKGFKSIIIPQFGKVDSMNVANSAAIVIYEAVRQRNLA